MQGISAPLNPPSDVFTHHDRVIDHDPRGEHEAKQDQAVEVAAAQAHQRETSDQGDRHGDAGDHGQPPAPEHQHQHCQDQQDGITQCGDGALEVVLHGVGSVDNHRHLDTWGKASLEPFQLLLNALAHLQGIGTIALVEPDCD